MNDRLEELLLLRDRLLEESGDPLSLVKELKDLRYRARIGISTDKVGRDGIVSITETHPTVELQVNKAIFDVWKYIDKQIEAEEMKAADDKAPQQLEIFVTRATT